jgi:PIN domain nuclease of toxin-antitoxin system
VRLLLDTHAFLWFITNDAQLSTAAKALLADPNNVILVSPASYWEIAIKIRLGKYLLHTPYETFIMHGIAGNGFTVLPIEPKHTAVLTTLPMHHRDPFDRLMVAQAMAEGTSLVSNDAALDAYPIQRLW